MDEFRAYISKQHQKLVSVARGKDPDRATADLARHVEQTIERPLRRLEKSLRLYKFEPVRSVMMASSLLAPAALEKPLEYMDAPGSVQATG